MNVRTPTGVTVDVPRLTKNWGDVGEETSDIQTTVDVRAPTLLDGRLQGLEFEYDVSLNDVYVASAEASQVDVKPDGTRLDLTAAFQHDRVPDWWKTHVDNDETTTLQVEPRLNLDVDGLLDMGLPLTDLKFRAPQVRREFETDVLGGVRDSAPQKRTVLGREVIRIHEIDAAWSKPTEDETPVEVTADVENPTRIPMAFDDVRYEIRMNDVVVGEGTAADELRLPARSQREVEFQPAIQTERLVVWWPTHVENDEETKLDVRVYAEVGPNPLSKSVTLYRHRDTVETDVV
ncbi:MAG: LEA type 2 family protein, partial [Halobacteriota archaeon]